MMIKNKKITIALAGNPNSGKTTVFNNLTGARRHVGNYPGVTVEKVEGNFKYKDYQINVVDLPGTYSLASNSLDEIIARNYLINEKPDVVVNIIDSSNLERNLYLTTQFVELGVPSVIVLNMYDLAQKHGMQVDKEVFSKLWASPIVFAVAAKNQGMDELIEAVIDVALKAKESQVKTHISYDNEIEEELLKLGDLLDQDSDLCDNCSSRWLAIKLLEDDKDLLEKVKSSLISVEILGQLEKSVKHLRQIFNDTPEAIIADGRYGFISGACSEAVGRNFEMRHTVSDKIDKILINKVFGLPIFLFMMWLVFKLIFTVSTPLIGFIESGLNWFSLMVGSFLPAGSAVHSLIIDGIIGGVGGVLVFLPIILMMYLAIAFLEGTGYMARAAFVMDRLMHRIGLHGRSFIPMLLGFGCNVPAIMAARTIEDHKDRMVTILINSFMSCGARLPVYSLFIAAFFSKESAGNVLFSLYVLGMIVAVIVAKIFRKYLFRGEAEPFVMELPPYRLPTVKALLLHMWDRALMFLKKAGTIIFAGCVMIWFLSNFPIAPELSKDYDSLIQNAIGNEIMISDLSQQRKSEKMEKSFAGFIGKAVAPTLAPLGFGDWKIAVGLIGGIVGKEIVVGTLGTLYAAGDDSTALREALVAAKKPNGERLFTPLSAYALMVFVLLYIPCVAVIAVIKQETNSWFWSLFAVGYTTAVAWIAAFIVYQGGRLIGL